MKYEIPKDLSFENLGEFVKKILISYRDNELDLLEVSDCGKEIEDLLWEKFGNPENPFFPNLKDENHLSIPVEIIWCMHDLDFKSGLKMLPIDVPYFLEFLNTPKGQEVEGWKKIKNYINNLKREDRIEDEKKQGMHRLTEPVITEYKKTEILD
jgi:hypothetical protein